MDRGTDIATVHTIIDGDLGLKKEVALPHVQAEQLINSVKSKSEKAGSFPADVTIQETNRNPAQHITNELDVLVNSEEFRRKITKLDQSLEKYLGSSRPPTSYTKPYENEKIVPIHVPVIRVMHRIWVIQTILFIGIFFLSTQAKLEGGVDVDSTNLTYGIGFVFLSMIFVTYFTSVYAPFMALRYKQIKYFRVFKLSLYVLAFTSLTTTALFSLSCFDYSGLEEFCARIGVAGLSALLIISYCMVYKFYRGCIPTSNGHIYNLKSVR